LPKECEWAEFKVNNSKPQEIGEYISALSNQSDSLSRIYIQMHELKDELRKQDSLLKKLQQK